MGNITINKDRCTACKLCEEVCPNKIIYKIGPRMECYIDRLHLCFKCGQCMCVCPTKSVFIDGLSYDRDFFNLPKTNNSENDFFNLISTRRAVRNFKETPVPKEVLEKIVEAISYAPPGFPPVKTEIIVVQDSTIIKKALPYMIDLYDFLLKAMQNPISKFVIRKQVGNRKFKLMASHLVPLLLSRMPALKKGTEDTITRNAPAMIIFHSDKKGEDIKEDIIIAATYCMLASHSMGLGGSIMDIIPPAIDKKEELSELFCIPHNHEVIASVIIGYPKYNYSRGIKRSLKSVKWI